MTYPTLKQGMSGPAVGTLQRALNQLNSMPTSGAAMAQLTVDSTFGPDTRAAVVAFQRRHGLPADGLVGPATWGALQNALGASLDIPTAGLSEAPPTLQPAPPAAAQQQQGTNWATVGKAVLGVAALLGLAGVVAGAVHKHGKAKGKGK